MQSRSTYNLQQSRPSSSITGKRTGSSEPPPR